MNNFFAWLCAVIFVALIAFPVMQVAQYLSGYGFGFGWGLSSAFLLSIVLPTIAIAIS